MTDHRTPDGLPNALRGVDRHLVGPAGPGGSRWWARADDGTRNLVTVVPGHVPGGPAEVRRRVVTLQRVQTEHIARLGPLLPLPDDGLAVLEQHVEGHDLATVQAARGPWSPGEVVAVLVPLAEAVAALHDAGLACRVTARNVVLAADGCPVLVGLLDDGGVLGAGGLREPDGGVDACVGEDVAALGRLGLELLQPTRSGPDEVGRRGPAGADPVGRLRRLEPAAGPQRTGLQRTGTQDRRHDARWAQVRQLLTAAAGPVVQERPSAARLAAELARVCPPAPVEQPDPAVLAGLAVRRRPDLAGERGRHRRATHPARRWLQSGAAVLAVALCGVTVAATVSGSAHERDGGAPHGSVEPHGTVRPADGAGSAAGAEVGVEAGGRGATEIAAEGAEAATGAVEALAVPVDAVDAAVLLTEARARALVRGDLDALRLVTVPGSPAALGDEAAARQAATTGLVGGTLSTRIELAERLPVESDVAAGCPGCAAVRLRSAVTVIPAARSGDVAGPAGGSRSDDDAAGSEPAARDVVLVLAPTDDGWRVNEVRPYVP